MEIVIIGLGSISAKHIAALKTLNISYTIKALRSSPDALEQEGITNVFSMEDIGSPDFVIISNPTYLHFETIKSIATLGLPMFIEKPAVHSLNKVDEILHLIQINNLFTYVACNLRFHPCIQFLKEYLEKMNPEINEVNIYCGSYLPDWRSGKDFREIYSSKLDMGGGVHLDLFHEIDYVCWLFGFPLSFKGNSSNKSTLNIKAPDYANYLLSYLNFNISILLNYYRRDPKRTIEILFNEGTWIVDLINTKIINDRGEIIFSKDNFKIIDSYVAQMRYFISNLKATTFPMNTFKESIKILKISLSNEPIKG